MNKVLLSVIAFGMSCSAFAIDAVWKEKMAGNQIWVLPQRWTDTEGNPIAVAPTNIEDNASMSFADGYILGNYYLDFGTADTSRLPEAGGCCTNIVFNKVTSPNWFFLRMGTYLNAATYPVQKVSVADPDDFAGVWTSDQGRGQIELRATPSHSPRLSNVDTFGMIGVSVPDAGTSASVDYLLSNGALNKEGEGNLTVNHGAGYDSRIYVRSGTLTLTGHPESAGIEPPSAPVPGAYLHLDASRADTFTRFRDEEGRDCIAEWRDCDGGSVSALTNGFAGTRDHQIKNSHAPYLSGAKSSSGLPLVDFGKMHSEVLDSGAASNCWLQLTKNCTEAREVFYVAACPGTESANLTLFGWSSDGIYDFGGGGFRSPLSGICASSAKNGECFVNGFRYHPTCSPLKSRYSDEGTPVDCPMWDLSVVSLSSETPLQFNTLASDRCYQNFTGGWQVGEILVYTNALTHEERLLVNRYLMKKWHVGYRDDDVGEVVLDTAETAISVPAGRIAKIRQLSTMGDKIVKTGDGTLVVDGVAPAGVVLEIRGGSLKVLAPDVAEAELPAKAYFHADATKAGSLETTAAGVMRWNDCDGGSVYAEVPTVYSDTNVYFSDTSFMGHVPQLAKAASPTGLDVIDFGRDSSDFTFMQLQPNTVSKAYCGFIVLSRNLAGQSTIDYFGSTTVDMLCHAPTRMLQDTWSSSDSRMASWSIDGRVVDPYFVSSEIYANTNYHVIAFSATTKRRCDLLAKYTLHQPGQGGGWRIGEFVIYDRMLTPDERRNAEAYLMKKWLGKVHPESREAFSSCYSFGEGEDRVIDTDASGTITNIVGGTGNLVKRGEGTVRIDDLANMANLDSISVEGGSATVRFGFNDDAAVRFDASDSAAFTQTYLTDDGEGIVTNIICWKSSVGNVEAISPHKDGFSYKYASYSGSTTTNPVMTTVEMRPGVLRPTVDFGSRLNVATLYGIDPSTKQAAQTVNPETGIPYGYDGETKSSGLHFPDWGSGAVNVKYKFKEVHAVHSDAHGSVSGRIFGQRGSELDFERMNGAFLRSDYSDMVLAGSTYCDGEKVASPATEQVPAGFHVISHQIPTATMVSAISMDRNCNSGGTRASEFVFYKEAHTPEICAFIDKRLMHKWFGTPVPVWVRPLQSLVAAEATTLTLETDDGVSVGSLGGSGTIVASSLQNVSSLALDNPLKCLTVSSEVMFADNGTVEFGSVDARLAPGDYVIFSAGKIVNPDAFASWTLTGDLPGRHILSLVVEGNDVILRVASYGMMILIR